tara:strand:- start:645 stop:800 length:156 start_codon:yes stop_codon:yes gene_type:complete
MRCGGGKGGKPGERPTPTVIILKYYYLKLHLYIGIRIILNYETINEERFNE